MDLVIISGIIGLGYFLNKNGKEPRKNIKQNNIIPKNEHPLSYDNYSSNNYEKIRNFEKSIAENIDNQSLDFEHSGIVFPEIYQDERILPQFSKDSIKKNNIVNTPLNMEHFSNISPSKTLLNDFYNYDSNKKFEHNNPYPSLRGNQSKQNLRETLSTADAKFEKKEVKSFAEPIKNITDFMGNMELQVDRTKSTITNIMNGVKLMQPIIEAPNSTGNPLAKWEGKNPAFRGYELSVDELRTQNNQKQDFKTDFKSVGSFIAQKPNLEQNDTRKIKKKHFEVNFDHSIAKSNINKFSLRPIINGIYETARSVLGEVNYKSPSYNPKSMTYSESSYKGASNLRGDETNYNGNVYNSLSKPTVQNRTRPKTTIKETLLTDYTGNAALQRQDGYKIKKILNNKTIRSTYENTDYTGNALSNTKKNMNRESQYNVEINALKSIVEKSYRPPNPEGQKLPANTDQTDYENFRSIRGKIGKILNTGGVHGKQRIHDNVCKKVLPKTNKIREIDYSERMEPFKKQTQIVVNPFSYISKTEED